MEYKVKKKERAKLMNASTLLSAQQWAEETFGGVRLGHQDRTERAVAMACAIARDPAASLPAQMPGKAALQAAYRFLQTPGVTYENLIRPHVEQTRAQALRAAHWHRLHPPVCAACAGLPATGSSCVPLWVRTVITSFSVISYVVMAPLTLSTTTVSGVTCPPTMASPSPQAALIITCLCAPVSGSAKRICLMLRRAPVPGPPPPGSHLRTRCRSVQLRGGSQSPAPSRVKPSSSPFCMQLVLALPQVPSWHENNEEDNALAEKVFATLECELLDR